MNRSRARRSVGCVTQKRGLWYAIVTLPRNEHGQQPREWSPGFPTRRKAERALAQLLIEQRQAKATRATVEVVVSRYIEQDITSKGRRSPTTTQRYWGLFRNMKPLHAKVVDKLEGSTIENFYLNMLQSGLSPTTVHHVHNLMFTAFRWASTRRVGLVTRNPFSHDDVERPQRAKSSALSLTIEQAERSIREIAHSKHCHALVFALASGCRRGECCGLKWDAVDFRRKVAIIREARYQVKGFVGQKNVKQERIREVPLNVLATRALLAERDRQEAWMREAGNAWNQTGFVFTNELGEPLTPMSLTNAFHRVALRAHLPTTRLHDLRHTAATFILSAGGNPVAASKILGHADETVTLRLYGHVIGLDEVRALRHIDKALCKVEQNAPRAIEKIPKKRNDVLPAKQDESEQTASRKLTPVLS